MSLQFLDSVFFPCYPMDFCGKCQIVVHVYTILLGHIASPYSVLRLHPENIAKFQFPETPPWTSSPPNINLEIAHAKKSDTNPAFYQAAHKEIVEHFPGYNLIYTIHIWLSKWQQSCLCSCTGWWSFYSHYQISPLFLQPKELIGTKL